ncbi:MAG TPA: rhodanese-like domain-containing protein [Candidatus Limnocylindrales bacterium]|nr:rhodanese-like domain-containing protein [Candidatus Limnocylindrales bacterium]
MAGLIDRDQLQEFIAHGGQLVEVLPAKEYAEDHLPGARSIPLSKINRETASTLDANRAVVLYCWDTA